MKRSVLASTLTLAVSGLLIAGAGTPANAAKSPRPSTPKASKAQALRDANSAVAAHPQRRTHRHTEAAIRRSGARLGSAPRILGSRATTTEPRMWRN